MVWWTCACWFIVHSSGQLECCTLHGSWWEMRCWMLTWHMPHNAELCLVWTSPLCISSKLTAAMHPVSSFPACSCNSRVVACSVVKVHGNTCCHLFTYVISCAFAARPPLCSNEQGVCHWAYLIWRKEGLDVFCYAKSQKKSVLPREYCCTCWIKLLYSK